MVRVPRLAARHDTLTRMSEDRTEPSAPSPGSGSAQGGSAPLVGVVMGSRSDWGTMGEASATLDELGVPHETRIVSAHRTPDLLFEYASTARSRGLEVIIAGAGGAAHLPGMLASKTTLPVLGVPVRSRALRGMDSLLSIVQMPAGVPVGTLAIGPAGATNAALLAASIIAGAHPEYLDAIERHRRSQRDRVLGDPDPSLPPSSTSIEPGDTR